MRSLALNVRTAALAAYAARLYRRCKQLLLRFAAVYAQTRIHRARLEVEVYLKHGRLRTKNDDDLPIVR